MSITVEPLKGPIHVGRRHGLPNLKISKFEARGYANWKIYLRMTPEESRKVLHVLKKYHKEKSIGEYLVYTALKETERVIAENKDDAIEINQVLESMKQNHRRDKPLNIPLLSRGTRIASRNVLKFGKKRKYDSQRRAI